MDNIRKMTATIAKDGDKAMEAVEQVREAADTAWGKGREAWNDLNVQTKEALTGAQESAEEAWEDAQKLVQKHPGKAVGLALLVGVVIGGALIAIRNLE
jgi:ElaB/YqjD/DUF883 family membrane-anchored ribosome-binding protein